MKLIFSNTGVAQNPNFGGKANQLLAVKDKGIAIPEFVIIPADYLTSLIPPDTVSIKEFIRTYQFSDDFINTIFNSFEETNFVAVRSSALNEDGKEKSFAGQYETKLFVTKETLSQAIVSVWLSAFSERVAAYRKQNNISKSDMAIIVQRMIDADAAGVAFAVNPLTGNENETVINAVWGLGEGIVSGELNADLFLVENEKITRQIAEKKWAIKLNERRKTGTEKVALSELQSTTACLNELQILEVERLVKKLSAHFQVPQDIEFAYQNNRLYLLQTRTVTAIARQEQEPLIIWDNSNIVESYPALTLPLTFSFIVKMYEAVYTQLSLILGVSAKTVAKNRDVYANMLGLLCGRVYYHLNNWHQSLSLLPGYKLNAEFMDNMMGVKEKFDTKVEHSKGKLAAYFSVFFALVKMLKKLFTLNRDRIAFQTYFNNIMREYEAMNFDKMSLQELATHYHRFENTLVKKWKAPLVNDFFCMIYFGVLQKLVVNYQLDENGTLHNDLVSGAKDIISTEPITLTLSITKLILQSPEATALFKNSSPEKILSALPKNEYAQMNDAIKNYIQKWGDRCVGELKLETITYKQQPENYIKILQSYVRNNRNEPTQTKNQIRQQAEEKVKKKLKGKPIKKIIFSYVLRKARYLVSNRENLRFERTRGFGMVRTMMIAIGKKFAKENRLQNERDIFYLTQNEIFESIKNGSASADLKALVELRKKEYTNYAAINLPERIKANGVITDFSVFQSNAETIEDTTLKGIGCCAGIVRGKVSVIHSPDEIDSLNNTILVTASTDPGWVVLFPSASAIVVERGSLLSHSAIVSREMGIPCVVGVKNLLRILKTGDTVEIDGAKGTVKMIEQT
jgi:pyruvate,water dikinase